MPSPARVVPLKISWLLAKRVPEVYPSGTIKRPPPARKPPVGANSTTAPLLLLAEVVSAGPKVFNPKMVPA
jgi:hypothetical protein